MTLATYGHRTEAATPSGFSSEGEKPVSETPSPILLSIDTGIVEQHKCSAQNDPLPQMDAIHMAAVQPLAGKTVLLVEDQTLIALDTENMLRDLAATEVATFANTQQALAWLADGAPAVAVLDYKLGVETSLSVAEALVARSIPFVFTSGYGEIEILSDRLHDAQVVQKPYTPETLARALKTCLD